MVVFNNRIILQQKSSGGRGTSGSRSDEIQSQSRRMQQNISIPARGQPTAAGDKFKIEIFRETEVDRDSDMQLEEYVSIVMIAWKLVSDSFLRDKLSAMTPLMLFNFSGCIGPVFCLFKFQLRNNSRLLYRLRQLWPVVRVLAQKITI